MPYGAVHQGLRPRRACPSLAMHLHRYLEVSQATDVNALRSHLVSWSHDMGFAYVAAAVVHEALRSRAL